MTTRYQQDLERNKVEAPQRKHYDLAELVRQITLENLHGEFDFGCPIGKEIR
jgi:antitoxin component of MazEF toxin-antitoxin module